MTRAWEGPRWLQGLVSAATKEEPYGCCSRSGSYTHVRQGKFLIEKYPPHSVCFNPFLICSLVEKPEKAAIHSVTTGSNGAPGQVAAGDGEGCLGSSWATAQMGQIQARAAWVFFELHAPHLLTKNGKNTDWARILATKADYTGDKAGYTGDKAANTGD
ncbi:hypothetical protein E3N88_12125 [Mikania micrantha]|uniref:Uncharacterized protein n=1 Tax=Mikania micrantha TaxID=192012 RepID=A0A5N6P773_9ASTR|nr:hypothetical protein E3N88_12125 [Mikania micrantha]